MLFGAVAADQAGSKLAFCSVTEPFLHVYNSTTLEELYCLEAAGNIKLVNNSLRSDMVWTVYGWLLVDTMNRETRFSFNDVRVMRLSDRDSGKVCQLMERRLQPEQRQPATSPDSAFLCVFNDHSATLKVHDARSGRVVLSQPFVAVQNCVRRGLMPDLNTKIW